MQRGDPTPARAVIATDNDTRAGPTRVGGLRRRRNRSELEESFAKNARLQATHLQLLTVAQNCEMCPARQGADLRYQLHICQRASTEPDETRGIQTPLQILEAVGDGVSLFLDRRDVQELAFSDD